MYMRICIYTYIYIYVYSPVCLCSAPLKRGVPSARLGAAARARRRSRRRWWPEPRRGNELQQPEAWIQVMKMTKRGGGPRGGCLFVCIYQYEHRYTCEHVSPRMTCFGTCWSKWFWSSPRSLNKKCLVPSTTLATVSNALDG